jgi:hypothetical protein
VCWRTTGLQQSGRAPSSDRTMCTQHTHTHTHTSRTPRTTSNTFTTELIRECVGVCVGGGGSTVHTVWTPTVSDCCRQPRSTSTPMVTFSTVGAPQLLMGTTSPQVSTWQSMGRQCRSLRISALSNRRTLAMEPPRQRCAGSKVAASPSSVPSSEHAAWSRWPRTRQPEAGRAKSSDESTNDKESETAPTKLLMGRSWPSSPLFRATQHTMQETAGQPAKFMGGAGKPHGRH